MNFADNHITVGQREFVERESQPPCQNRGRPKNVAFPEFLELSRLSREIAPQISRNRQRVTVKCDGSLRYRDRNVGERAGQTDCDGPQRKS